MCVCVSATGPKYNVLPYLTSLLPPSPPSLGARRRDTFQIQRAIWYAYETLACFDVSGTILGRLWCLYEMFYTLICKQCAHVS